MSLPRSRFFLSSRAGLCLACLVPFAAARADTAAPAVPAAAHFLVTAFGAVPDGRTLNTASIQRTIDAAAAAGGGVVEIPKGRFLSGSIFLGKGTSLALDEGAVLLGSNRIGDYPMHRTRIEGHFETWPSALVNAQQLDSVRIGGKGKIDGNGIMFWAAFWQRRKENPACTNLEVARPRLIFVDRCRDVRIQELSLRDSGYWNLHLYCCQDVRVEGLSISAPSRTPRSEAEAGPPPLGSTGNVLGPSTDGIDVDSCRNVVIRGCRISVNDDNIALKGSKGPFAEQDVSSPPDEDILIENCEFGDGNGVVTCGSEATTVRNVTVRNCTITGRTNLVCLKLRPDTPQHYVNILVDGIRATGGQARILQVAPWTQFFDLQGQPPPSRSIEHLVIRNISGSFASFGVLHGSVGDVLSDISLENFDVHLAKPNLDLGPVQNLRMTNIRVNGQPYIGPAAN